MTRRRFWWKITTKDLDGSWRDQRFHAEHEKSSSQMTIADTPGHMF
ncbi:MAG TPA: hypothetical protein VHA33_19560 [Candidatus Angelobacter sp.]|jgi:hypothetical protein|nr:hypothetical protein [Candidatus Angelobacter sp.]